MSKWARNLQTVPERVKRFWLCFECDRRKGIGGRPAFQTHIALGETVQSGLHSTSNAVVEKMETWMRRGFLLFPIDAMPCRAG
jgi:hypothetical protein